MDEKLLSEIKKTCADARFGYGGVTIHTYYRHVSALLAERKQLQEAHKSPVQETMSNTLSQLRKDVSGAVVEHLNEDLRDDQPRTA